MANPLTRADLDMVGCGSPDCGHDHTVLLIGPECHPKAGLRVCYLKPDGTLHLRCRKCDQPVGVIAVAAGDGAARVLN